MSIDLIDNANVTSDLGKTNNYGNFFDEAIGTSSGLLRGVDSPRLRFVGQLSLPLSTPPVHASLRGTKQYRATLLTGDCFVPRNDAWGESL